MAPRHNLIDGDKFLTGFAILTFSIFRMGGGVGITALTAERVADAGRKRQPSQDG